MTCLFWAWKVVKSESVSVNEAEYCCWNFLAERKVARTLSECGCVEDVLPAHTGNEVSCGVALWPC